MKLGLSATCSRLRSTLAHWRCGWWLHWDCCLGYFGAHSRVLRVWSVLGSEGGSCRLRVIWRAVQAIWADDFWRVLYFRRGLIWGGRCCLRVSAFLRGDAVCVVLFRLVRVWGCPCAIVLRFRRVVCWGCVFFCGWLAGRASCPHRGRAAYSWGSTCWLAAFCTYLNNKKKEPLGAF